MGTACLTHSRLPAGPIFHRVAVLPPKSGKGAKLNGEISSSRLKAVGYADSQPLVPNNTDMNRKLNNRMEFYFHLPELKTW